MSDVQSRLAQALAGRYALEREVGRGGMSIVYLAYDERLSRKVALKILRPELAATLGPERFLREIKVVAGLTHPHILPLHDSGEAAGMLYYVMPYVEGESLRHRLTREGRLPLEDALEIARQVADALEYAHQHDVVHRDIKPENILLQAGQAVVSDFGIARAISEARARVTGTGVAVGTPDYMSPEQASGGTVDGRTDVYSLGCVLYEMLVGQAPGASSGGTGGGAARAPAIKTISAVRPAIPIEVEAAIEEAMAQRPEERFPRAADFARALREPGVATVSGERRRHRARRRWWVSLALVAGLSAAAGIVVPSLLRAGLDASLYVVVPFGHREGAAPRLITGDQCESLLLEAFGRWNDVRAVDDIRVHDLRLRRGLEPTTLDGAFAIARAFGAGRLVWGEVAQFGDTVEVRAALYDVKRSGATVRRHAVRFGADARDIGVKFRELADSLLLGHVRSAEAAAGVVGTRLLAAWQAYETGQEALASWDLDGAERNLRTAIQLDPEYAHAHLWLAQTLVWAGRPVASWRPYAVTAARGSSGLATRGRALARALAYLANQEYSPACAAYRGLLARDSLDFAAWFGMGECQTKDRVVLRDASSPSGWRFRSSYAAAARAYQRALELIPSIHRAFSGVAFTRLTRLFYAETNVFRPGYSVTPDTVPFGAWPGLDHDTLVFAPFPLADLLAGNPGTTPATTYEAVARSRQVLRGITLTWVRAFPNSADAREALAGVLETLGELADDSPPETSAFATLRAARRLSIDSVQRLRLAAGEVRIRVKLEDYRGARALADSVLAARRPAGGGPDEAEQLVGLATLTGRVYLAAKVWAVGAAVDTPQTWDGLPVRAPRPVTEAAGALLAYAALGGPRDSLIALRSRVDRQIDNWVEEGRRPSVRQAVLHVPLAMAFPELGASGLHGPATGGNYLLTLQWHLSRGETAAVRAQVRGLDEMRAGMRPGDVAVSSVYHEAWVLLAIGDTAAAVQRLDATLTALPTLGLDLIHRGTDAALLVRAMALRADLAAQRGDGRVATRWADATIALWSGADPPLQLTVSRMRKLVAGQN